MIAAIARSTLCDQYWCNDGVRNADGRIRMPGRDRIRCIHAPSDKKRQEHGHTQEEASLHRFSNIEPRVDEANGIRSVWVPAG
jgi:hypothetical protein